LPAFDLDDNLGEDYFAPEEDLEGDSSATPSQKMTEFGTDYVPSIGTKISSPWTSEPSRRISLQLQSPVDY